MLAAGLFDSPWVVAAIIVIGAFVNWLSQLRQQKQQRDAERRAREGGTQPPQKPEGDFDLEETLKRWLGEEAPKPTPAPPPVPRAPGPQPVWQRRNAPPVVLPLIATAPVGKVLKLSEVEKHAAARLAQASEQVRQHHASEARTRRAGRWSGLWRDRSSVRRAFVGSLVFGPPKGLES